MRKWSEMIERKRRQWNYKEDMILRETKNGVEHIGLRRERKWSDKKDTLVQEKWREVLRRQRWRYRVDVLWRSDREKVGS